MFLMVHAGAGFHSLSNESKYKKEIQKIIKLTINGNETETNNENEKEKTNDSESKNRKRNRNQLESAEETACFATELLETFPLTNAGISGANFTLDGKIECDSAIMNSEGYFASVAAVPLYPPHSKTLCLHPIAIATRLLKNSLEGPMDAGRQPPLMLCGPAAQQFALDQGLESIPSKNVEKLISSEQKERYKDHLFILKRHQERSSKKVKLDTRDMLQDTVGAIALDSLDHMASCVSSGGISLKHPGRIGEAALPGVGAYVQSQDGITIGVSLSGTGEQIIKTNLGTRIVQSLFNQPDSFLHEELERILTNDFLNSPLISRDIEKNVGVILVKKSSEMLEAFWGHTTTSFCIGFSNGKGKSKCIISRKKDNQRVKVGGQMIIYDEKLLKV